jgi:hypothetical protein
VEGEDVGVVVEGGFVYGLGWEVEGFGFYVEDVVVEDAHAEAVGGDVSDAFADAAHAEDADGQLVELSAAEGVADALELGRFVGLVPEGNPGAEELKGGAEDEVADGQGVGVGGVDDLDAAFAAGVTIDVLDADAAAADDLEAGGLVEQGVVDLGVGPDGEAVGLGRIAGGRWRLRSRWRARGAS